MSFNDRSIKAPKRLAYLRHSITLNQIWTYVHRPLSQEISHKMGRNQILQHSKEGSVMELESELMELSRVVHSSLVKLKGPLRHVLREKLHDPDTLPHARCYDLAAEAIDVLHEAQQSIEPRTLILADHFLG